MGEVLSYSIVSGGLMLSMFLAYKVFLAGEKQHGYNRGVLLMIYAVAFAALPVNGMLQRMVAPATMGSGMVGKLEMAGAVIVPVSKPFWGTVMIWIYVVGMAVVAVRTVATWLRLLRVVRNGEKYCRDGYVVVLTDDERFAPFSWMKYIVMSRADCGDSCNAIATHEKKHIECRHWIDLMIAQLVCIVNWFNPAAWLMRNELMLVHEYQADMAVIAQGHNIREYQMLLIKKAVGARFPSLANSLNHSKLKKRITMMYKEKSGAGRKLKALALVPMLALALGVASVPAVRAAVAKIRSSEISISKSSEIPDGNQTRAGAFKVTNLNNRDNSTTVTLMGTGLGNNITVSGGTFTTMGKTYKAKSLECSMTDGNAIIKAVFPYIAEFDNSAMTLTINGEDVPFSLEKFFDKAADVVVVDEPEVMPEYPGGMPAIMNAVMKKLTFPDPQRKWKADASGRTVVRFTVFPDGTIGDVERVQSCGYGDLDQIAINAVMEGLTVKWKPGTVDGKPVAVSFTIPVHFKQER